MGDRGQVFVKDTGVYLYTHWRATELIKTVQAAFKKGWRWNDPEYLTRIIFDTMIDGNHGNETGFGISTEKRCGIWRLITVDCASQIIKIEDHSEMSYIYSFETFIEQEFD